MRDHLFTENTLPGFIGHIHRKEGDETIPRFSQARDRDGATAEFQLGLEEGETLRAIIPMATIAQLGTEAATAFRPDSQFELEDLMYVLDKNEMVDLAELGTKLKGTLGFESGPGAAATGPFRLKESGALGAGLYWHNDEPRDAEMIANLFEEALLANLIEVPTANGSPIALRVGVDKGFGSYIGQDTCWIRMYCEEWEYLASEVMPASADNLGIVIARAGRENGSRFARELILLALEYANTVYCRLGAYLNEEEKKAAGFEAVTQ